MDERRRLPPPSMELSTRLGLAGLAALLLAAFVSKSSEYRDWILVIAFILGPALLLVVISDLGKLRQQRMLVRHIDVHASKDDGEVWLDVRYDEVAAEHMVRWRKWSPWLYALLISAVVMPVLGVHWYFSLVLVSVAIVREYFLALNVVEWMAPSNWGELKALERLRLRLSLLAMASIFGAICLGLLGLTTFMFFVSPEPLKWNAIAFALVYGTLAWPAGVASFEGFRRALRRVPPPPRPSVREV